MINSFSNISALPLSRASSHSIPTPQANNVVPSKNGLAYLKDAREYQESHELEKAKSSYFQAIAALINEIPTTDGRQVSDTQALSAKVAAKVKETWEQVLSSEPIVLAENLRSGLAQAYLELGNIFSTLGAFKEARSKL